MSEERILCGLDKQFTSVAEEEDWFVVTRCGHVFHNYCIKLWIEAASIGYCPLCRENITLSELRRLHTKNPTKPRTVSTREPDYNFKIILLGGNRVGKSYFLTRYTDGTFPNNIKPTIGVVSAVKRLEIDEKLIELTLWDTAGHERFNPISGNFARNAHGVLLVYSYFNDGLDSESLMTIQYWIDFLKKYRTIPNEPAMILVGNKSDIAPANRGITSEQGHEFAKQNGLSLYETSAKDDINVDAVFKALVVDVLDRVESNRLEYNSDSAANGRVQVSDDKVQKKNSSCY